MQNVIKMFGVRKNSFKKKLGTIMSCILSISTSNSLSTLSN